ncbi:succinylglutamate desuccinylase/aspartoacylase family protein [Candidatus Solirubrobacter pratensis]|uniref:succinylglutamate desuccinylase/aspartoacylase family protein n=1 Tax=Candidatus Solirubrobacter pratensis TaxID=1298857 RepID=UPI00040A6181|nr:succinylglutamate desuccinylase/aspartoacylase family protein [Candidatus Solirubrobacter pratensis]
MITRKTLTFDHPLLRDLEHPCFEARGAHDGPRLTLMAGVHGCEYSSIAAATRFMRELDTAELSGTIVALPIASLESFRRRSPFVVPIDGKNLNRSFPGDPDGGYTDALAAAILQTLIAPADAVIDLHGGDMVESLEPFAIYESDESEALAQAFGLPYVTRAKAPSGMTCSAAGGPAIIAEAGGIGQLEEAAVELLVDGTRNALRHLGMLPGGAEPRSVTTLGEHRFVNGVRGGWWETAVATGASVREGESLGVIKDLFGDVVETVASPQDGVVLWQTTSPAVGENGLLLGLA